MSFLRRNLSFMNLAVVTNLEYRLNYFFDALAQPIVTAVVELAFWTAIFASTGKKTLGGFDLPSYLAYAIWASFIARISVNWMYEYRMMDEIESGSLNTLLIRPMSFFEYYLSQFMGYKFVTIGVSLTVPVAATWLLGLPLLWHHLFPAILLAIYYLIFLYLMSFLVVTFCFHLTRIHGISIAKNLSLWILSGELLPLDLFPEPYRHWLTLLPFSNGVFVPVSYITGRVDSSALWLGFESITVGIAITSGLSWLLWRIGLKRYVGTGA